MSSQKRISIIFCIAGIVLIVIAYVVSSSIPEAADQEFDALVSARGGQMSGAAGFQEAYKQRVSDYQLLQDGLVGGAGLVLLMAGTMGLAVCASRAAPVDGAS